MVNVVFQDGKQSKTEKTILRLIDLNHNIALTVLGDEEKEEIQEE